MADNATAIVRMEEGYMRLTLEYNDPTFKTKICKYVGEAEKSLEVYPEVLHRRDSAKKCFTSIEFSGDEYICSRSCGDFIETVVSGLGIKQCITD
ncbi:hypothetical protein MNB_SV-12-401 [hydrothermal vent metagenome]|uniref:Uncharacterized protein n=1 Tax=hydrothermal vent metagenome TaxID=652676 RepID=A0A1W1CCP2_9ZZZZ